MENAAQGNDEEIPKVVAQKYKDIKKNDKAARFSFFKEYIADPACGSMSVNEHHVKEGIKSDLRQQHWRSRYDIECDKNAHINPQGMETADDICRAAKESYQHPDHPGKPLWMMYLVYKDHVVGEE